MPYDLDLLKAPRSMGGMLRLFVKVAESRLLGGMVAKKFLRDVGITGMRTLPADDPPWEAFTGFPVVEPVEGPVTPDLSRVGPGPAEGKAGFPFETSAAYVAAYHEKRLDPVVVAERVLAWSKDSDALVPPMRVFIAQDADDVLAQARASAARYKAGKPLGPLDGVPIAVKDEFDQRGYPRTVGTSFLGAAKCTDDADAVARLRATGAILIGKGNMHEIGMGVTGINPHHGPARNPYDPARCTGGSSSGPAAAVAAGLCPVALGADGGGSVRIPATLCGLVGLKPTFGRVSEHGAAPLCWSVAHIGPLAASVRDAVLVWLAISGPDPHDPHTLRQPGIRIDGWDAPDLRGVRLGICTPWFEHADEGVVAACRKTLDGLCEAGAQVVEVDVPELNLLRSIHMLTIASEMQASQMLDLATHRKKYGHDIRLNLAVTKYASSGDYVHAQRHRTRLCRRFADVLARVDALVYPSSTVTAPPLPDGALRTGISDLALGDALMRNSLPANITGLPAIGFPAGYDAAGLPVGLQVMGRAWDERLLLHIAAVAERFVKRTKPLIHRQIVQA